MAELGSDRAKDEPMEQRSELGSKQIKQEQI